MPPRVLKKRCRQKRRSSSSAKHGNPSRYVLLRRFF
jgi:hypothetical protein